MRLLRTYTRVAHTEHFCAVCLELILPGDRYEADVYVCPGVIIVLKRHIDPPCDLPDPPFDEEDSESDREGGELIQFPSLRRAA